MNKTLKLYAILFGIVLLLLAVLEMGKKEVTDWRKNFDVTEKSPFGLYIFNQEADKLIGNLHRTVISPYDYFEKNKTVSNQNYVIIQRQISETFWNALLEKAKDGSDVMVISTEFSPKILDTLDFYTGYRYFEEKQTMSLTDQKFRGDSIIIEKFPGQRVIDSFSKGTEILGAAKSPIVPSVANFIKVKFGKGNIYLHSDPIFLTNYYLLKPGYERYAQDVFSYLPARNTVWFMETNDIRSNSPLRFILANPPLRYAWWLLLAGLLIFVIFNVKRRQRVIPLIPELKNKSVEFVKSIGNLYLQEGDFHDMMAKKAQYFLNRIRMDLLIDTHSLDEEFAKKLQLKTGKPAEIIDEAINLLKKAQDPYAAVTKEDLIRMNRLLDEILK